MVCNSLSLAKLSLEKRCFFCGIYQYWGREMESQTKKGQPEEGLATQDINLVDV
ncbi:hypothetical protein [Vibrio vulnificus YJ016]|uniref:Uncharacterized protein n=1 Tax=Vibrio vulnificus (strain YJ016) TaxID=196600 RepID=Q7MBU1_VIBVY|nr:hypothetical protein [Vibrio vulnificus YJ016]